MGRKIITLNSYKHSQTKNYRKISDTVSAQISSTQSQRQRLTGLKSRLDIQIFIEQISAYQERIITVLKQLLQSQPLCKSDKDATKKSKQRTRDPALKSFLTRSSENKNVSHQTKI